MADQSQILLGTLVTTLRSGSFDPVGVVLQNRFCMAVPDVTVAPAVGTPVATKSIVSMAHSLPEAIEGAESVRGPFKSNDVLVDGIPVDIKALDLMAQSLFVTMVGVESVRLALFT